LLRDESIDSHGFDAFEVPGPRAKGQTRQHMCDALIICHPGLLFGALLSALGVSD